MTISFIESPFCSKVEYEAWLKLPAEEQQAALDAKGVDSLTEAAESLAVSEDAAPTKIGAWEPLTAAAEWDPLLDDLEEMGFGNRELNRTLMLKNSGNVKRTVKDLVEA